jgi:nitroreductase
MYGLISYNLQAYMTLTKNFENREAECGVDEQFISRWSPRAFDPNYILSQETLDTLLEAARWSWSSSNLQPWRYIHGLKGSKTFEQILSCLTGGNESWAKRASCLMLVIAKTTKEDGTINGSALFDTGAATMSISLQANLLGLVDHHMGGMDRAKAKELFGVTDEYVIHCTVAIGKLGSKQLLFDHDQSREFPNTRKSIKDLAKTTFDF